VFLAKPTDGRELWASGCQRGKALGFHGNPVSGLPAGAAGASRQNLPVLSDGAFVNCPITRYDLRPVSVFSHELEPFCLQMGLQLMRPKQGVDRFDECVGIIGLEQNAGLAMLDQLAVATHI
jgi:hypothetical protein